MNYHLYWLQEKYNNGERPDYLYFWGHRPSKDGKIIKTCFSQWWEGHPFVVDGIEYLTAEHWMMWHKAKCFEDTQSMEKVLSVKSPHTAKKIGRQVKNYKDEIWLKKSYELVKQGNIHKFEQHEDLKTFLLGTENKILVEASPYDNRWGIGLQQDAKDIENPNTWRGLNFLGFALMETRDFLKK